MIKSDDTIILFYKCWQERNICRLMGKNTEKFLIARGWKKLEKGKFRSPYDPNIIKHPLKALKTEREMLRNQIGKIIEKNGYDIIKGHASKLWNPELIEKLSKY